MHPILQRRPFEPELRLVSLEGLGGEGAHSGTAFRVLDEEGRAYKLRECGSPRRAKEIERLVRGLPWLFPSFVARDGSLLLLDLLQDHRPLTRHELLARAGEIGELAARLHRAGRAELGASRSRRFSAAAATLGRFFADLTRVGRGSQLPVRSVVGVAFKALRRLFRYGLPVELELDDVHKDNFMWHPEDDDLRYVDEEAIGLAPRGLSMATLLKTANLSDTLEAYREGYSAEADASWIEPGYVEWLLLQDAVRRVAHKLRSGLRPEKLPDEIAEIRAMADTRGVTLEWRFPKDAVRTARRARRRAARAAAESIAREDPDARDR
ncbi:MAG: hypothetical protein JRH16_15360 [Deltaproteobacteria bacterium]|nr:hypothetical protein [Deltaproteobacteria bacterium]MBW2362070.1 hypothetical protein [Deltaproteobacteria bacterium]